MNPTRHLSFGSLRHALSSLFQHLPDPRQPGKVDDALHDALMSGFACMCFQDPSLLPCQQRLEEEKHRNNLHTLFGIHDTPESTQMRELIDQVDSHHFRPILRHCSADSEIAIDRAGARFYTTGPNLLLLRGAHHVRTG